MEARGVWGGYPPNAPSDWYLLFRMLTVSWLMVVNLLVIHWGVSPQTPRIVLAIRKVCQ